MSAAASQMPPKNPIGDLHDHLRQSFEENALSAQETALVRHNKPSRSATLHLINTQSRHSILSFLIILTSAIILAFVVYRDNLVNTGLWLAMVLLSTLIAARRSMAFRAGDRSIASRPLRWRAHHSANLAVIGTALASGLFLLADLSGAAGQGASIAWIACSLITLSALAGFFQRAHVSSVVALLGPTLIGVSLLTASGILTPFVGGALMIISGLCLAGLLKLSISKSASANSLYPRTRLQYDTKINAPTRQEKLQRNTSLRQRRTA